MDLTIAFRYLPEFLHGLWLTALLSIEVILVGTFVGLVFVPPGFPLVGIFGGVHGF